MCICLAHPELASDLSLVLSCAVLPASDIAWSTYYKAVRVGVGGSNGGHVLRETTSRGLCGLVCPSRTSECGGEGYCVKEGGGEEGERERERARKVRVHYRLGD
jgi:hypothetical protein